MSKRLPIIRTARPDPGPWLPTFWEHLSSKDKTKLLMLMHKKGNHEWHPRDIVIIEPRREIVNIMQEKPKGTQAVI